MMMNCLSHAGLEAAYDLERSNRMNSRWGDNSYKPNASGFFELSRQDIRRGDFPRQYDGKLIKCLIGGLERLAPLKDGYRIVLMRRDPEEIKQSYDAFFGRVGRAVEWFADNLDSLIEKETERLLNRRDVLCVDCFNYRSVVEDPVKHFWILASHGWPIDPEVAASRVDTKQCRFRIESLVAGAYQCV